jgi:hypothetical protein
MNPLTSLPGRGNQIPVNASKPVEATKPNGLGATVPPAGKAQRSVACTSCGPRSQ